jgi:hypothetical protein
MRWKKMGHVFGQNGTDDWRNHSALTPTPFLIDESTIRVYAGFRDKEGISRIGYVDVDSQEPTKIIKISEYPVLDRGRDGCFDDNGVILGDVVKHGDVIKMYYVGFQLVRRAKFLAFSGLAESRDGGDTFHRVTEAPILDRANGANTIRAIHTAIFENGVWKVWYAAGNDWEVIGGIPYPRYNIWYTESLDGKVFSNEGLLCVDVEGEEYRIGRPSVYKVGNEYRMLYTKGGITGKDYFPGLAKSLDGKKWSRIDSELGLELSKTGFDSMHLCYPRLVRVGLQTFCFYNGNNMGAEGFGVAELLEW